jgi:hypothetical protein
MNIKCWKFHYCFVNNSFSYFILVIAIFYDIVIYSKNKNNLGLNCTGGHGFPARSSYVTININKLDFHTKKACFVFCFMFHLWWFPCIHRITCMYLAHELRRQHIYYTTIASRIMYLFYVFSPCTIPSSNPCPCSHNSSHNVQRSCKCKRLLHHHSNSNRRTRTCP